MHLCVCEAVFVKEFCKRVCVCAQVPCGHVVCMSPRHPPALTVVCSSTGAISVDRLSSQNAFQLSAFQNNRHWCPRLFLQGPSATQRFNMPPLICWSVEGCMWCVCVCARVQDVMIMGGACAFIFCLYCCLSVCKPLITQPSRSVKSNILIKMTAWQKTKDILMRSVWGLGG